MHLEDKSQPQITIGSLRAGESANVWWNVKLDTNRGSLIKVKAEGLVSGDVPKIKKKGFVLYPSYEYTDNIGGKAKINI
jgi:O-glycosyl hydrolase